MGILGEFLDAYGPNRVPKSFRKGQKFEDYAESFFPESHYILLDKVPDYLANKARFIESSLKPDFTFRDKKNQRQFFVEAKYRSDLYKGKLEFCKNLDQLRRYKNYDRQHPVFLLLGLGGKPSYPEPIFLVPVKEVKYTGLYPSFLEDFLVEFDNLISSKELWRR